MKKILKYKEAGIPTAVGVLIVVIALVVAIFIFSGAVNPYWETESEFGAWGEEIIIEYEDGTTTSLKMIEDQQLTTVEYQEKNIVGVTYKLSAKASGTGYDSADIDMSGFMLKVQYYLLVQTGPDIIKNQVPFPFTGTKNIVIDDAFHQIGSTSTSLKAEFENEALYPTDTYVVLFKPTGLVQYRGIPGGSWDAVDSLPAGKTMIVEITQQTAGLNVVLSSEYEIIYE